MSLSFFIAIESIRYCFLNGIIVGVGLFYVGSIFWICSRIRGIIHLWDADSGGISCWKGGNYGVIYLLAIASFRNLLLKKYGIFLNFKSLSLFCFFYFTWLWICSFKIVPFFTFLLFLVSISTFFLFKSATIPLQLAIVLIFIFVVLPSVFSLFLFLLLFLLHHIILYFSTVNPIFSSNLAPFWYYFIQFIFIAIPVLFYVFLPVLFTISSFPLPLFS